MSVDGDDTVGVFIYHDAVGIHAEGADIVLKLLCAVDDLALIELVGQVGKHHGRQLYPNTQVHSVAPGGNVHFFAHGLHPFAAAASYGHDTLVAVHDPGSGDDLVASLRQRKQVLHRGIKIEIHLILQVVVEVLQDHIVDIRAQMADGGIQQLQLVLDAELFELGAGGGVELGSLAAEAHIDVIHIMH